MHPRPPSKFTKFKDRDGNRISRSHLQKAAEYMAHDSSSSKIRNSDLMIEEMNFSLLANKETTKLKVQLEGRAG